MPDRRRLVRAKYALDRAGAAVALAVSAPLFAGIAVWILLDAGRPILFVHPRAGEGGRPFRMLKFRTMVADAIAVAHATGMADPYGIVPDDPRITRSGRFLRRTSLDELPQLVNVLRGDMSLVGPRPIRPAFFAELCETIPQYWQRLVVRPGLTGFAQLRLTREMTWAEKLAHDFEYIADRSVRLYVSIVAQTVALVLSRPVAAVMGRPRTWA